MASLNTDSASDVQKWENNDDDDIEVIPLQETSTFNGKQEDIDILKERQHSGTSKTDEQRLNQSPVSSKISQAKEKTNKDGVESTQSRGSDSRRPSDVTSIGDKSIASQSDTRSYRERIRDRISIVKERAGISAIASQKAQKEIRRTNKQTVLSRITNLFYQEEAEVEAALEKHRRAKECRRHKRETEPENGIKEEEGYLKEEANYESKIDFFTKTWDDATEQTNQSVHTTPCRETSRENIDGDETKLLTADYLGLRDTVSEPTEFRQPVLLKNELRDKLEQQLLFYPIADPVPIEQRLQAGKTLRDIKDEGLFVAKYPTVRRDNMNKYHQRLITSKNLKWFGEDGQPFRLADPLEKNYCKLPEFNNNSYDRTNFVYYEPPLLVNEEQSNHVPNTLFATDEECYILEVEILNITFNHHPLFSREHVLTNRLVQLYEKYEYRQKVNFTKRLATRLEALRKARDNLVKILKREDDEEMAAVHLQRLNRYKKEIRETRQQWMIEGQNDNQLLVSLLSHWNDLKRLREIQGYTSTPVKLEVVQTENPNSSQLDDEINRQFSEIIEEMKEDMVKNEKDVDFQDDTEEVDNSLEMECRDDSSFLIDTEKIKKKVIAAVTESMSALGESAINVCMAEQRITQDHELSNPMEMQRRSSVKRSRLWYRVCYNEREVCKSSPQSLNSQFACSINHKITIRIQEWPEVLSILIYCDSIPNKGIFNEQHLAEVYVPIPSKGQTLSSTSVENYEFSSLREVGSGVRHSGIGSRVPFKIFPDDNRTLCLYTTAVMACKTGWGIHEDRVLSPPEQYFTYAQSRRQCTSCSVTSSSVDILKLKDWVKSVQLDPNDPNNAELFELIKRADSDVSEKSDEFRINSVQRIFDFCSDEELTKNPRLKLLTLRDKGEIEFKNIRAIPLREWEIPKDIFKMYEKRISSPDLPFDTFGLGQLEIHRAWGHHSLMMIYSRILKQCRLSQQLRTTQDVVHEEKIPSIGTLGLTFMKLLQPKRPLRPRRKGRKTIPVKGLTGQEVKVIVNVVRAFEVPVRKDVDALSEDNISTYTRVRPFVEITFKEQTKRTVTADGPNPTWNQDLHFSLLSSSDSAFHISTMRSFDDSLHLHLFDEIIVDILEDERKRNTTIHQRMERNWLGSLRIPISTLYFNHQIEGTFQLYSPPFLLGYDRYSSSNISDSSHMRNSTFLTLFIIVQPPLSPRDATMEHLECNECSYLEQYLESWAKDVFKQYPKRPFKTLITDTSAKSVCVTRFFRPITPPVICEEQETTAEMIARYVSLIPVSSSGVLIFGHFNVWLTCDQTVRLLLGEREDHAILLCCLFMKLGLKSWLLLGNGIPHGFSAYVLTRDDSSLTIPTYNIWDPVSGLKYSSLDSFSPLHKVSCLINDENIWVNIQTEELIRRTNFDVTQQGDWWPAFDRNTPAPVGSVQPAAIDYTITCSTDVHLLQDKIEKCLRDSIMKWRPMLRTVWNRYCIATLRKLLPALEREACGVKSNSSSEFLTTELQHILSSYKICGFPISQPFSNMESILESVKSTGVHFNENPDVEFAIAVYVHPYPGDVLSVWVYAVSLIARR